MTWPIVSMGSCFLEVKGLTWNCCDHIITDVCENEFVDEKNRRSGINSELDLLHQQVSPINAKLKHFSVCEPVLGFLPLK